jgi:hypothetical protein
VLAIDGHTVFSCQERKCEACIRMKNGTIDLWCHKVVVAQWVASHPVIVADLEPIGPGNPLPSLEQLQKLTFGIIDRNGDGKVSRTELSSIR